MIAALVLAAALARCNAGTTYDIRACWSKRDVAAGEAYEAAYQRVVSEMRKQHVDPQPLAAVTAAWKVARDTTCQFEYEQYLPGTIAPQLRVECDVRMTEARTARLDALFASLRNRRALTTAAPISTDADTELNRVYGRYRSRLAPAQRAALESSQRAFLIYRDKACVVEGGACARDLANERIAELESSWLGEPFWR